jgi:catechol 2,3-dioxygenase-like lactoylglutathione lyase family enzyme
MGGGSRLSGAVVVVRDLVQSEQFYRELLDLRVASSSAEAVLLSARTGDRLILRALPNAPHVAGGIGVHFLVWTAQDAHDLDRCEELLRARGAFVSRWLDDGWHVLEGRDPNNLRVIVVFPGGGEVERTSLPSRIYQY